MSDDVAQDVAQSLDLDCQPSICWRALDRVLPILIARYPRGRGSLDTIGAIAAGVGNVGHFSFSVKA